MLVELGRVDSAWVKFVVVVRGVGVCPGRWSERVIDGQVPMESKEEFEVIEVDVAGEEDSGVLLGGGLGRVPPNCVDNGESHEAVGNGESDVLPVGGLG